MNTTPTIVTEAARYWIVACEFDPFPGGQGTYAQEMALALRRAGKRVTVIAPAYPGVDDARQPYETRRVLRHQSIDIGSYLRLRQALADAGPDDAVLNCDIRAGLMVSLMPRLKPRLRVAMFHGGEILHASRGRFARLVNQIAVLRANRLVANSSYTADLVRRYLTKPCEAIPLGVGAFWYDEDAGAFDSPLLNSTIAPSDSVVCLVARVERRKGHTVAIEAMKRQGLHQRRGFKFVFAGRTEDPAYHEEVMQLCREHPQTFIYAGEISRRDVRLIYRRSRALVLAAQPDRDRIEGFGLVITEAAAQGCPSVATRVGGIADALQPERTGFLLDHDDIDGIGAAIVRLLDDDALHRDLVRQGRSFVRGLSWDGVAQRTFCY